jgi:hypothetical protein
MTAPGTLAIYIGAALAEIAGCFAVWAWMRQGSSALWLVPGLLSLAVFAWLLTFAPSDFAGRAYAAYGGVYVAALDCREATPGCLGHDRCHDLSAWRGSYPLCAPGGMRFNCTPFNRMCVADFFFSCHAF